MSKLFNVEVNTINYHLKEIFETHEFVDNYNEEIWDKNLRCVDMYYYSKDLKRK